MPRKGNTECTLPLDKSPLSLRRLFMYRTSSTVPFLKETESIAADFSEQDDDITKKYCSAASASAWSHQGDGYLS